MPAPLALRRPGFFGGIRAFFEGLGFVVGTPSVWGYALVPMATAVTLMAGLGTLAVLGASRAAAAIGGSAATFYEIVLVLVGLLTAVALAFALAQPLSGWALDRIVDRQALALGAPPPVRAGTALSRLLNSIAVNLLPLLVSLPIFAALTLLDLFVPPAAFVAVPLKFVIAALLVAWDFLDYPLSMRGLGVRQRLAWIGRRFGAVLGFGLAAALLLLAPCVGLLVLPFGVAGAARLVVEVEHAAR